jgi:hypothetical protein
MAYNIITRHIIVVYVVRYTRAKYIYIYKSTLKYTHTRARREFKRDTRKFRLRDKNMGIDACVQVCTADATATAVTMATKTYHQSPVVRYCTACARVILIILLCVFFFSHRSETNTLADLQRMIKKNVIIIITLNTYKIKI